jgi:flagellar hook-length control protein FliK
MNIRGTDPTALPAVTDLFLSPLATREGGNGEFERALLPLSSTGLPSAAPARREDAPQTPASATRSDEDRAGVTNERPAESAPSSERAESDAEPAEDRPGDEEAAESEALGTMDAAQVMAAAGQLAREQKVIAPSPAELNAEGGTEEAEPILAQQPEGNTADLLADQHSVKGVVDTVFADREATDPAASLPQDGSLQPSGSQQDEAVNVAKSRDAADPLESDGATPVHPTSFDESSELLTGIAKGTENKTERNATAEIVADDVAEAEPTARRSGKSSGSSRRDDSDRDSSNKERPIPSASLELTPPGAGGAADSAASVAAGADSSPAAGSTGPADAAAAAALRPDQAAANTSPLHAPANPAAAIIQRLPGHALVRHAAEPRPEGISIDSARFLQRVAKAFEAARERGGEIRLRLSPPELGALRIEVTMQEQGMVARLEVETPEARAALMENLPLLRERLAEQNLRLERFDVELSQRESPQQGQDFPDQHPDRQPHSQPRQPRTTAARSHVPSPFATPVATPAGMQERRLNVIV